MFQWTVAAATVRMPASLFLQERGKDHEKNNVHTAQREFVQQVVSCPNSVAHLIVTYRLTSTPRKKIDATDFFDEVSWNDVIDKIKKRMTVKVPTFSPTLKNLEQILAFARNVRNNILLKFRKPSPCFAVGAHQ